MPMPTPKSKLVEIKTKPTVMSVAEFISNISEEQKRKDCLVILELMKKATGEEPVLWGNGTIGFGNLRYKSPATGREVDWFKIGFAARKANLSLHLTMDIQKQAAMLERLGKHKTGVGCLYINKLSDVDINVLNEMIVLSVTK